MKVCIATITIGEKYQEIYKKYFMNSHIKYCKKHGYHLKNITDYLTPIKEHSIIALNKILIPSLTFSKNYDVVVIIDADIIITNHAPPIHEFYDFHSKKIGVVNNSQPTREAQQLVQAYNRFEIFAPQYYKKKMGKTIDVKYVINTGVIITQPKIHAEFLKNVFSKYYKNQINNPHGFHYEQAVVGYELYTNNNYCFMDMKWNAIYNNYKNYCEKILDLPFNKKDFYDNNYFIHFGGFVGFDTALEYNKLP